MLHNRVHNMSTSKLLYDYVSGFYRESGDDPPILVNGRLPSSATSTSTDSHLHGLTHC